MVIRLRELRFPNQALISEKCRKETSVKTLLYEMLQKEEDFSYVVFQAKVAPRNTKHAGCDGIETLYYLTCTINYNN